MAKTMKIHLKCNKLELSSEVKKREGILVSGVILQLQLNPQRSTATHPLHPSPRSAERLELGHAVSMLSQRLTNTLSPLQQPSVPANANRLGAQHLG